MTSHEESIKQLEDALKVAKYRLDGLTKYGLTHYHVWYAPKGALALVDKSKDFGIPMSADEAKDHEKLSKSYLKSSRTLEKPKYDDLREYQSLKEIRKGFDVNYTCPKTRASLNKMLDDIYTLWVTEYEAFILAQEEGLLTMM